MQKTFVDKAELQVLFHQHADISNQLIEDVAIDSKNKLYQIFTVISGAINYDDYTFEENFTYNTAIVKQCIEVFEETLNEDEIRLCVVTLFLGNNSVRTEDSIPMLESVINISVDEDSWLWVLRENARYKLMGILSRQCKDFKRLAEMVDLLKPNRDKFDDRLDELQNNKI